MKKAFCFKTDKSLGMAKDNETGEDCEAYIRVVLNLNNPPSDVEREEAREGTKRMIAEKFGIDFNLIYPISENEYIQEVGEN